MANALFWLISIIGPILLLVALIWLVFMRRSNRTSVDTERATRREYAEEELRRRRGIDDR